MAGRRPVRPRVVSGLIAVQVDDEATQRALDAQATAIQKLQATRERVVVRTNLLIGTNRVRHGLGRPAVGYAITPTFATIAFGHAINIDNPRPELEVWIDVVGSDQTDARLEVW